MPLRGEYDPTEPLEEHFFDVWSDARYDWKATRGKYLKCPECRAGYTEMTVIEVRPVEPQLHCPCG